MGKTAGSSSSPVTVAVQGKVHGGQQPLSNAQIVLWAAGLNGYKSIATSKLDGNGVAVTDENGNFSITGRYNCQPGDMLYLIAIGGNPGLPPGTNNSSSQLMAALGACSTVIEMKFVSINEVTTVAAAYALAPFMADDEHVGTSPTNLAGLQTAFANAFNLVDPVTGFARSVTPAGNGVVPQSEINSLANALASCVNSDGATTTCDDLFTAATPSGGVKPSNTLSVALNIAQTPGLGVGAIYALASPTGPFQPSLSAAPLDWSVCVVISDGFGTPDGIAIDAHGNVWVSNYSENSVGEITGTGTVISDGYLGSGLGGPIAPVVDPMGNIWVSNFQIGTLSKFSDTGLPLSPSGFTGPGVSDNRSLAIDGMGNVWTANYANGTVSEFSSSGIEASNAPFAVATQPTSIAIDNLGTTWVGGVAGVLTAFKNDGTVLHLLGSYGLSIQAIAIDSDNNLWMVDYYGSGVSKISNSGTILGVYTGGGINRPYDIAVDGGGNAWVANSYSNVISRISSDGTKVTSYSHPGSQVSNPQGIAADAAGTLWFANRDSNRLDMFIGAAVPTLAPYSTALAAGQLGTRP